MLSAIQQSIFCFFTGFQVKVPIKIKNVLEIIIFTPASTIRMNRDTNKPLSRGDCCHKKGCNQ